MIPESRQDILHKLAFANVATIGPDGAPQNNPVWFLSDGETVRISMTPQKQKYRNIERDRRVAVSILDPDDPYRYLEIRGEVTSIEPDADSAFVHELARKYTGDDYRWLEPGEQRLVVTITAEHTTGG